METYNETCQNYEIQLSFSNGKTKKLLSKQTKEDAYQQGIDALKKYPNTTGFILFEKTIQRKYLTEVKNKII